MGKLRNDYMDTIFKEVNLSYFFNAPREKVFKAFTDEVQLAKWWGPKGFVNPICILDAKPGGVFRIVMKGPDGVEYPTRGIFHEIIEPEKLVLSIILDDSKGHHLVEDFNIITFSDLEGKTQLSLNAKVVKVKPGAENYLDGMDEGWKQSFERLDNFLTIENHRHPK